MSNLFTALKSAPASVFTNITPGAGNASQPPENNPQGAKQPFSGEVSEAETIDSAKDAENIDFGANAEPLQPVLPAGQGNSRPVALGGLIEAKMLTELIDTAVPAVMVICMQYFAEVKMSKRDLQLTEKEKAILNPVLQVYLNSVSFNFDNPLQALLITIGTIYGAKFAEKGFAAYTDKKDADAKELQKQIELKDAIVKEFAPERETPVVPFKKEVIKTVILTPEKVEPAEPETEKPVPSILNRYGYDAALWASERIKLKTKFGYAPSTDQILAVMVKLKGKVKP